jgi:phage terminase large subunit-like protein
MPWVVIAGVSEAQTENTLAAVRAMAQDSDLNKKNGGPLDIGITRIFHEDGGKLIPITASSSSQEGARPTFAVADEPHHWTKSNGGQALARVIRRNLAKVQGRLIETTNAHEPGQDSVAEQSYQAFLKQREGKTRRTEILYDCREAPALSPEELADEDTLRAALLATYGDSVWVDIETLIGEIYDPDTSPEESRRFYLNQIIAAADSWLRPDQYDVNSSDEVAPLAPKETVTLGFDGALTDDSSALVAVRVSDGAPFLLGLWEKGTDFQVEIDKSVVRGYVENAFETYDVVGFFSDVAYWETDVDAWRETYGERLLVKATTRHAVAWDMRGHQSETVLAVEALHRAFTDREIPILPDDRLKRHVLNARRRPNRWGVSFGKETRESPHKVDALAALVLARMARSRVLSEGVLSKRRGRVGKLVGFR